MKIGSMNLWSLQCFILKIMNTLDVHAQSVSTSCFNLFEGLEITCLFGVLTKTTLFRVDMEKVKHHLRFLIPTQIMI